MTTTMEMFASGTPPRQQRRVRGMRRSATESGNLRESFPCSAWSILTRLLDDIAAELRRFGYLVGDPGRLSGVSSAFGHGQVSFEQWLERVFLPNARAAVAAHNLPRPRPVAAAAARHLDGAVEAQARWRSSARSMQKSVNWAATLVVAHVAPDNSIQRRAARATHVERRDA